MILYFSGTGNSEYVARRISEEINDSLLSITASLMAEHVLRIPKSQVVTFVTPTYAWRIPRVVEAWIKKNTYLKGQKVYFVLTCGSDTGDAGRYLKKLCEEKELEYMGYETIVMPENYLAMFQVPDEEVAKEIIQQSEPLISKVGEWIHNGEKLPEKECNILDRLKSGLVNDMFYQIFVKTKKFSSNQTCIGCGKCENVCPLHNIVLKNGKPFWNNDCTHCMACITSCPVEAIEYGKRSKGQPRYRCPL